MYEPMIDPFIDADYDPSLGVGTLSLYRKGRFVKLISRQQAIALARRHNIRPANLNLMLRRAGMKPYYPRSWA